LTPLAVATRRPSIASSFECTVMPAFAAGLPAITFSTRRPPPRTGAASIPIHASPLWVTRPSAASWRPIATTVLEGIAKPMPVSSAPSVGRPMTAPRRSTSAPPLLPGKIGAEVWISPPSITLELSCSVRLSAETMPWVTLPRRPSGLPSASTTCPSLSCDESANSAGGGVASVMWTTARSTAGKLPETVALCRVPSLRTTFAVSKWLTTWALVTTFPWSSSTTPEPRPSATRTWTTDGAAAATAACICVSRAAAPGSTGTVPATALGANSASAASAARSGLTAPPPGR
jgi:hypothetical protein